MARYTLGDREYPSKKAATEAFRTILNAAALGTPLDGEAAMLVGLLLTSGRHPEAAEKIGPGIASIVVRPAAYGTRCFWMRRTDGTEVDFSYLTALNGPPSPKAGVVAALRFEISDQIEDFRRTTYALTCALCSEPVSPTAGHVDHADPSFDDLTCRFARECGGWSAIAVACVGPYGRELADRDLALVWVLYHRHTARLRLVHPACNLTRTKGAPLDA